MEKRLIPYSVHLPEPIFNKLKQAAGDRKAAGLVRDAITMFVEGGDLYKHGYAAALRDCAAKVQKNRLARSIAVEGEAISDVIVKEINSLNH